MDELNRFRGCLLGLAAGDAVGTTVEFRKRGTFEPVVDMIGGGPFNLCPGEWTDDTSMALCLASSLIESTGFDAKDQIDRFCRWRDEGYMSSNGRCFDIGNTVGDALGRYSQFGNPLSGSTDPRSAGNGSIMRLAPVPMYFAPVEDLVVRFSGESSRTTHGSAESVDACRFFGLVLHRALQGDEKDEVLASCDTELIDSVKIKLIADGAYRAKTESGIKGTGYVVDSLEAALWCFLETNTFEEAILRATNLGDDADTTAAICGQVAGAYYGETGIPDSWLEKLVMRREIGEMAEQLHASNH